MFCALFLFLQHVVTGSRTISLEATQIPTSSLNTVMWFYFLGFFFLSFFYSLNFFYFPPAISVNALKSPNLTHHSFTPSPRPTLKFAVPQLFIKSTRQFLSMDQYGMECVCRIHRAKGFTE
ncbi:hypothetical protein FPQ18DRAFT_317961 [Pyronema domesticum]|nr:hypothetical protein FPQ18DRAFT_317961 [Pyronema domesticum]